MKGIFELDEVVNAPELENLVIMDMMNFAFRYKHRGATNFCNEFIKTIDSLAKSYGAKDVILTADKKYSKYRKHISPEYKTGRKAAYKDQTPEQEEQAQKFFEEYERTLEVCKEKYPLLRFEYVEADDLAAYLVKNLSPYYEHIWLISSDADWDLLLSDKVSRFSFVTRREYTVENFYDNHSCDDAEQFVSLKVLKGDAGDTIAGIESVGDKRAYVLLREYGTALDIYDSIPLEGKQKFVQNINNSGELILTNYLLIDLLAYCEDAIGFPDPNNLIEMEKFCDKYKSC